MRVFNILAMFAVASAFKLEENESVWYAKQGVQSLATAQSSAEAKYGDITATISKHKLTDP